MRNREFDNILDDCLERLLVKGESLEQCLERYPEQSAELRPLLETALEAREAAAIQPRPDFRAQARYRFHQALEEMAARKSRTSWGWFPRWATVAAVVTALVVAGGGTVAAADNSMPDSPLYPVKLATEEVRLTLTISQMDKARLCAELADERVTEIAYMAVKGDAVQVEIITRRLDKSLDTLVVLIEGDSVMDAMLMMPAAAPPPGIDETQPPTTAPPGVTSPPTTEPPLTQEAAPPPVAVPPSEGGKWWGGRGDNAQAGDGEQLKETVAIAAFSNQAVLNGMLDEVPEQAREALRHAIAVSENGYNRVLEALEQS